MLAHLLRGGHPRLAGFRVSCSDPTLGPRGDRCHSSFRASPPGSSPRAAAAQAPPARRPWVAARPPPDPHTWPCGGPTPAQGCRARLPARPPPDPSPAAGKWPRPRAPPAPDAVLVQRVQAGARRCAAFRARLLIEVLEALAGREAALRALLGHVQPPTEAQLPRGAVVGEEHREAVVALRRGAGRGATGALASAGAAPPLSSRGTPGPGGGARPRHPWPPIRGGAGGRAWV